jgi:hypothetical protein
MATEHAATPSLHGSRWRFLLSHPHSANRCADAIVISWLDIMKESNRMPGGWFEQKLLKQRFEVLFLTIDSVK